MFSLKVLPIDGLEQINNHLIALQHLRDILQHHIIPSTLFSLLLEFRRQIRKLIELASEAHPRFFLKLLQLLTILRKQLPIAQFII